MSQNYYEVLGLARGASVEDIKKSYRKLVRKYHPDVSKEPDAQEKMQQINLAYETLSDDDKRAAYEQQLDNPFGFQQGYGPQGQGGQPGADPFGQQYRYYRGHGNEDGQDFNAEDFRQQFGSGGFSGNFEDLFGRFGAGFGAKGQQQSSFRGQDQHASITVDVRVAYEGTTQQLALEVPVMTAQGAYEIQRKTLQVKIPKGMKPGQQIRLGGQGQPGVNGGPNGDLYIEIQYQDTEQLHVDGTDVYLTVPVTPWEAALGEHIQLKTPAGELGVKIPANSQTGKQLRLKGKGIPASEPGNLYLVLKVVLPEANTEQAKALYAQMAHDMAFNPRAGQ